jgi:FMN phosphatase YigB (HAD superfamily)
MMGTVDWDRIDLVVFDLDGTLYDQGRLRAIMASLLVGETLKSCSLNTVRVLSLFREMRERLASGPTGNLLEQQFEMTSAECGRPVSQVRHLVQEWMERKPLRYLAGCRYSGVAEIFESLRRSGRKIAILSDYAVSDKLSALGLKADIMVSAEDADIQALKPDPKGLRKVLDVARVAIGHSLMVGDRFDRDWEVANCVGMKAIIRSGKRDPRCITFKSYHDPLFDPVRQLASFRTPASSYSAPKGSDVSRL